MKRAYSKILLSVMVIVLLTGCGKSQAVKDVEEAIGAIGEVSVDKRDAIKNAEKLYNILSDGEKADVSNRATLVDAQEAFKKIQEEQAFEDAKIVYGKLNDAADRCINGMTDIYGAWYFGIYKADEKQSIAKCFTNMAKETPHFSYEELLSLAFSGAISGSFDWQFCVNVIILGYTTNGEYEGIDTELKEASDILNTMTSIYDDSTYYPKLKDYYNAVKTYFDFFKSPSGSFSQLTDSINSYEKTIKASKQEAGFLIEK